MFGFSGERQERALSAAFKHQIKRTFPAVPNMGAADCGDRIAMMAHRQPIEQFGSDRAAFVPPAHVVRAARRTRRREREWPWQPAEDRCVAARVL